MDGLKAIFILRFTTGPFQNKKSKRNFLYAIRLFALECVPVVFFIGRIRGANMDHTDLHVKQ